MALFVPAGLVKLLPEGRSGMAADLLHSDILCLTAHNRAMLMFAEKLTTAPWDVCFDDTNTLQHGTGLGNQGRLDLVQCISYFAYMNRPVLECSCVALVPPPSCALHCSLVHCIIMLLCTVALLCPPPAVLFIIVLLCITISVISTPPAFLLCTHHH